ncbi:MAG TPA: glycoside hydrolase family 25 protein [Flavisolibacter sp.]
MAGKKQRTRYRFFIWFTVLSAALFMTYLAWLWWQSRQLHFVRYPQFGIHIPYGYEIHGIDVSRYQHTISWKEVKEMQVQHIRLGFAFIKATEGVNNTDPFFRRNWRKSKQAGLVRGAYHFFLASKDAAKQAENFIGRVELQPGDLPPVLDVEQNFGLPPEQLRASVKKWLDLVEAYYGVKPIIYTYVDFYKKNLAGYFDEYPLWIAHYLQPEQPRITRSWSFWQHSERGRVNGITSRVDFNVFNGDSAAFRALLVP